MLWRLEYLVAQRRKRYNRIRIGEDGRVQLVPLCLSWRSGPSGPNGKCIRSPRRSAVLEDNHVQFFQVR